jgi:hypothetical protein
MKNTLFFLLFILGKFTYVWAQTSTNELIEHFIYDHEIKFNKEAKIVYCNNLDSLLKVLKKNKINYAKSTFDFTGNDINESALLGGSSEAVIMDKHKPFIYFRRDKFEGGIRLTVVSGHNYL